MHPSLKTYRSTNGFTLVEIMVAFTIFSLVIAAASTTYIMGVRVWRNTSARIDASTLASTALTRCTLGIGGGLGLRSAFNPVQVSSNNTGWQITFLAPAAMEGDRTVTNTLVYSVTNRTITYRAAGGPPSVIGHNIVASTVTRQTDTVNITVRARSRFGITTVESEMSTAVVPRNRI